MADLTGSPQLSIVIPTKDRVAILHKTLSAVQFAIRELSAEIIIVNDGNELLQINSERPGLTVILSGQRGVAAARNKGAAAANGKWLLFLDDDILVSHENLVTSMKQFQAEPNKITGTNWIYPPELDLKLAGTRFGRYLMIRGYTTLKGWRKGETWDDHKIFACEHIASAYLPVSAQDFHRAGGYDEDFPHAGFEDMEFCKRLLKAGMMLQIDPHNIVYHNEEDRLNAHQWLSRKRKAAETKRVGFEKGSTEARILFSPIKEKIYRLLAPCYTVISRSVQALPPWKWLDSIYFRCVDLLLGLNLYIGYRK